MQSDDKFIRHLSHPFYENIRWLTITMAESVEYKVLIRHTVDLQLAVKDNLTPLGAQLVSAEIITLDQYREIRNPHRPVNERGADLVEYVQNWQSTTGSSALSYFYWRSEE